MFEIALIIHVGIGLASLAAPILRSLAGESIAKVAETATRPLTIGVIISGLGLVGAGGGITRACISGVVLILASSILGKLPARNLTRA